MKGRYNLMIFLGIDISKLIHFATILFSNGEIIIKPFQFSNDYKGFYLPLSKLASLDQHSITIALESTTHYGDILVRFLIRKDFKVCVINPIATSSMPKNNICKANTDKVDTFVITKTLIMKDSLRFLTLKDPYYIGLKVFGRIWQNTAKQHTRLKI